MRAKEQVLYTEEFKLIEIKLNLLFVAAIKSIVKEMVVALCLVIFLASLIEEDICYGFKKENQPFSLVQQQHIAIYQMEIERRVVD